MSLAHRYRRSVPTARPGGPTSRRGTTGSRWRLPARTVGAAAAGLLLAGCSAGAASTSTSAPAAPRSTAAPSTTVAPTTTTTEQPGWTPVSSVGGAIAVDTRSVTEPDGATISLYRFRAGKVTYGLHVGSTDPPQGAAVVSADSGPTIGPDEAPYLVAAFNGGFKTDTGSGGFELNGQTLVPLQTGLASLVIDTDGTGHVGIWGQGLPAPGESVADVRQNLSPLVAGGAASPQIASVTSWGATLGGGSEVARSALGQDAAGNLVYAGSMDALPSDVAAALVTAGAVTAMELDINPEWVQLDYAPTPGAALVSGVPGTDRPANQYQQGWTRDFVTVLGAH